MHERSIRPHRARGSLEQTERFLVKAPQKKVSLPPPEVKVYNPQTGKFELIKQEESAKDQDSEVVNPD